MSAENRVPNEEPALSSPSPTVEVEEKPAVPPPVERPHKETPTALRPFSAFTSREKLILVSITGICGVFSPMASYIYFPAIPLLADDFHTTISLINLTVTMYLVFQGVSPMFWAPIADSKGRRSTYLACLFLLAVSCIAIAVIPTDKWWILLILRCFQASGSASTVAIGSGVVSDIALPAERGGYYGLTVMGTLVGPCVGPVLGGVIGGTLGWRWIFWFLCILTSTVLIFVFLIFPETLRCIVGDGTLPAPWWDRPVFKVFGPQARGVSIEDGVAAQVTRAPVKRRSNAFKLFLQLDIVFMLLANALIYGIFVAIQATTSLLLQQAYPYLSTTDIGLCFLPMGVGSFFSSLVTGKHLDWQYRRDRRRWETQIKERRRQAGLKVDGPFVATPEEELTFPIEKTRLKWAMVYTMATAALTVGYGWLLDKRVQLAGPLIFQFVVGWVIISIMNSYQTLLIDAFPTQGSASTAINNFCRCLLSALITSVINLILDGIGIGWTFALLGCLAAVWTPFFTFLVIVYGPRWRARRLRKGQA